MAYRLPTLKKAQYIGLSYKRKYVAMSQFDLGSVWWTGSDKFHFWDDCEVPILLLHILRGYALFVVPGSGVFGTRGAIWDGLLIILCVDCRMSVMNSDFNLRFGTCKKSQISLIV